VSQGCHWSWWAPAERPAVTEVSRERAAVRWAAPRARKRDFCVWRLLMSKRFEGAPPIPSLPRGLGAGLQHRGVRTEKAVVLQTTRRPHGGDVRPPGLQPRGLPTPRRARTPKGL
jgi:hypothetical protein